MSDPIDYSNLDMLKGVIGDDLKPILSSFLEITPDLINKVEQAITAQNATDLQHQAHTLKGSAANVGAIQLPEIALQLEQMGKNNQLDGAEDKLEQVRLAYTDLAKAIDDYLQTF